MTNLQIKYFLTVAKYRGFRKAAQALFISQPSLTQQIASMEKELGFKLFNRGRQALTLTREGECMFAGFTQISSIYQNAYAQAKSIAEGQSGTISVGLLVMMDFSGIPERFFSYCGSDTGRTYRFRHDHIEELAKSLMSGEIDLCFMFDDLLQGFPSFKSHPVFTSEYQLVFPAGDEYYRTEELDISRLQERTFFVPQYPNEAIVASMEDAFRQIGIDTLPRLYIPSLETIYAMVASGAGFALGSDHNTQLHDDRFFLRKTGVFHEMHIVWNPAQISAQAKNCLKEVFGIVDF